MLTEEEKKRIVKFDNLTFAIWSLDRVINHINICCETCGLLSQCKLKKKKCDVDKAYNHAEKALEYLRKARWRYRE